MNPAGPPDPPPELFQPRPSPIQVPGLVVTVENVQQEAQDLRTLLHATFVALIFLALGLNLFLWKQMRMARDQLDEHRGQMERAEAEFLKRDPEFKHLVTRLQQYASTHADYSQILVRYRGVLPQYLPSAPFLSVKPDPATLPAAPAPK
jgi:hypothetical protein